MADIELVIKIPEDVFKRTVFYREFRDLNDCVTTIKALEKAVQLPKGHGRLIDADELKPRDISPEAWYSPMWGFELVDIEDAPTIIEADRSDEE